MQGFKIALVGSKQEKLQKKNYSEFENYDIRGTTDIIQLFELFNNSNVKGVISFDTALSHLGLLYEKDTIVKIRKNPQKNIEFLKNNILPSYKKNSVKIEYI